MSVSDDLRVIELDLIDIAKRLAVLRVRAEQAEHRLDVLEIKWPIRTN